MDTTKAVTHVGLCAGYGGIELGLSRAIPNLRSVALCEIEAFACANLVAKMEAGLMDAAPIWTDLKTFPWAEFRGRVDILTSGYPCQPFSAAGKRLGKEDPRHLWPFIADGIRLMRPNMCFFENVEGHITLGLSSVISDLEELGYKVSWGVFSAAECGAPHQRKRVFILAYCKQQGLERFGGDGSGRSESRRDGEKENGSTGESSLCLWPSRPGEAQHGWEPPRVVGDSTHQRDFNKTQQDHSEAGIMLDRTSEGSREGVGNSESRTRLWRSPWDSRHPAQPNQGVGNTDSKRLQEREGQGRSELQGTDSDGGEDAGRQAQPALGGDSDGPSSGMGYAELCISCDNRADELRLLGNGVVPATAEQAFRTLLTELLT